jgi:hypothetical protein
MMATKEREPGIFIWTKSERAGQVVTEDIEKVDRQWLYFTDGTRINKKLINEYTLRAATLDEAKRLAKPLGLTTIENGQRPTKTETKAEVKVETKTVESMPEPVAETNVMLEMLKKMSKKNTADMPVSVNIPSKSVYKMLKDEMDLTEDDLHENISLLIESQIDNLRDQLKSQIETFIKSYYNVRTSSGKSE